MLKESGAESAYQDLKNSRHVKNRRYSAKYANGCASGSRHRAAGKRVPEEIDDWIKKRLLEDWTPEHIAGRSAIECSRRVSHEYVYRLILKDRRSGGKLYQKLKRFRRRKRRFGARVYERTLIPQRVPISMRPKVANERKRIGDLEGDLIVGHKQSGYILTVIDRKTRLVALEYLSQRKKGDVERAFLKAFKRMPAVKTLTLDNAREFTCHVALTEKVGVDVYFADPYASHQRGSVENINGWIRYYFPKKSNFTRITTEQLRHVEQRLNTRPRKVLDYLTPQEVAYYPIAVLRKLALHFEVEPAFARSRRRLPWRLRAGAVGTRWI